MNPTTQPEAQSPGKWGRLAWLPIPLLLLAIIAAKLAGLRESYESHTLLLVLSFTFYTLVSLGTLYLIGRSFLTLGSPALLLLECGVVLWSLAGTVGDFVSQGDANINVTIFNIGILLSGLCHLAGAILALSPQRALRTKPVWLSAGCVFALGALWLVAQAALSGWLPPFFIPGQGGTLVRYWVLISAVAMFVLSAGVLRANQRAAGIPFTSWYALAMLLLAVGLFGIMIQLSLGSVVNWLSRAAQWLGGTYLLFAALASLRQSHLPLLPPEKKSHPAYYRYAVAVSVVLAAAAIRLAFLSAMGTQAPYLVFFPAVTFAAIYGGLGAGLLATALSAILTDYFWIEPVNRFTIGAPSHQVAMGIFLLSGAMIAWVSDSMHRARARAIAAEAQALIAAEREKTAEALHEGRAKLEAALASMTDAVSISDARGRFIDFNDAFATYHRFRNKDECLKTLAEYPDILDVFMANGTLAPLDMWAVPRALRGETVTNAEYTLRRKYTGETWVGSYSFAPILDKDGAIVGSVVVGRDITDRKRAETEMERIAQQRQLALDAAHMGWWHYDPMTRIASWDDRFREIFGVTGNQRPNDEILAQIIHPDDLPGLWAKVEAALNPVDPKIFAAEYRIRRPDGAPRWIEAHGVASFEGDGANRRATSFVGTVADSTERKRAEEALKKTHDELEKRVQERTEELQAANKELRGENEKRLRVEVELRESESRFRQLSAALLSTQEKERKLIAREIHDSLGASLAAAKFKVEDAGKKMGDRNPQAMAALESVILIIQGTVEEARRIQMSLRPSMLDDLGILSTIGWFCRQYESTYSAIRVNQEIHIEENEVSDPLKIVIFRVLQEAMNNIAKHSKANEVVLTLRKIDQAIELVIRDNGHGFRVEDVLSRKGSSRGLGLDSMKERTDLAGGTFTIESTDSGTVIRASWPL